MKKEQKGFTLTESMVSLALISFSSIFIMKCIVVSLNGLKNSNARFAVEQALENRKNFLLGVDPASAFLSSGRQELHQGDILITVEISDIGPGIKRINVEGRKKDYNASRIFYRSEILRRDNA